MLHKLSRFTAILALPPVLLLGACAALKSSYPLLPDREYERMLMGPLEADYIGNEACLKACHQHDQNAAYLRASVHGQQMAADTGMPLVNCETCHGPGSLAVSRAAEEKKCDTSKFIPLKSLPAGARSLLCLTCHSSFSMRNIGFWQSSHHAQAEVSCDECHQLHTQTSQKVAGDALNQICYRCHPAVEAQFAYFSRHPLREGRMTCNSCHEPHGSIHEKGLVAEVKSLCLRCHADKTGPFVFEHADIAEDCGNCHAPHGSPFSGLLRYQEPFLCLQCHTGHTSHPNPAHPSASNARGLFTRCTTCHSQIHGSDADPNFVSGGLSR